MVWRREIGIDDDELVIVFLGRIVLEKGLDVFSETVRALRERGVKHHVMVIGEGPARPWFEEQMPGAIFVGQQTGTDLARALASADVFLNPSSTEAFGNVTLEAMASGLPVVAAEATGATTLVRTGETGVLVEAGDIDGFADALEAYARDPELRRRHGEGGLAFAKTMDWDAINSAAIDVYQHAIAKRERLTRLSRR
jgi:glycosyltransferase involved in cell wall biosynthesis